jgi:hypothetical protein
MPRQGQLGTLTSRIKILGSYLLNHKKIAAAENLFSVYIAPTVLVPTKIVFVLGINPKTCRFLQQFIEGLARLANFL